MPVKEELTQPAIWFTLTIENKPVGYFTEASGLTAEIETFSYNEGGRNEYVHKLPTRMKHPNLVLKRGVTKTKELQEWFQDSYMGPTLKPITVRMVDELGEPVRVWSFNDAYPVKWTGPQFNAAQNTVATEAIEITHAGYEIVAP
jgi:phage tail-like protein